MPLTLKRLKPSIFQKILFAMFMAATVPLCAIWYVNYQASVEHIRASVDDELAGVSDKLVTHVNDWVQMNVRVLQQSAHLRDVMSMDQHNQTPILKSILSGYEWSYLVFTVGPDGKNIARSDDKELVYYGDRVYFHQVMAGAPWSKQVVIGKTSGKPALILSAPIESPQGIRLGVIAMAMNIADISDRIAGVKIGTSGYAFLLDESGKVVAHPKNEYASTAADFSKHPAFLKPNETTKRIVFEEDGRKVLAYAERTAQGWTMVTQQDYDEAFAAITKTNHNAIVLLVITLIAAGLLAYLMSQRLAHPIRRLTAAADEISRGKFNTPIPAKDRSDEIGALAEAIERMSISIRMALDRLRMRA